MRTGLLILTTLLFIFFISCNKEEKETPYTFNLIPMPSKIIKKDGVFTLNSQTVICYTKPSLEKVAVYLSSFIKEETGLSLDIITEDRSQNCILLDYKSEADALDMYYLDIKKNHITVEGFTPAAVMLAIQTIRQLIASPETNHLTIPCVRIIDQPKWGWRGMMMDVARHFFTKEEVKEFLDLMAYYKFNKFHWHLTDDQGWRIEIKSYPLLCEEGAWRTLNNHDRICLQMAERENNTDLLLPESKLKQENGVTLYGGYYTQEDIKEVVAYATMLGIDIIPEIDIPGHSLSAINAYPELSCFNSAEWGNDFSTPLCPGKDHTLEMYKNIYRELFELFPYKYFHIGADEVEKINWEKCPHCKSRIEKENLKDEKELQSWFVFQMEEFFRKNDKEIIGWDEIAEGGLSQNSTLMWWRTWAPNTLKAAIDQSNYIILTPNSHYYFDYDQTFETLRDLYEFDPVPEKIKEKGNKLILGVQANTWAETIPSRERFQYMTVPRMLVLSEIAWQYDPDRSWEEFLPRLITHFSYLDKKNINYRPLDVPNIHERNVFVGETSIVWDHPLKGIELRYTKDGSIPNKNSLLYNEPLLIDTTTSICIRMFRPDSSAADIIRTSYIKAEYRKGEKQTLLNQGLICYWYEGVFSRCAQIETVDIKEKYNINSFTIPKGVGSKRGLVYKGYIDIPHKDVYTFYLGSDDGSTLFIGDELIVDNDGPHGPITVSGQIALDKGLHPIKLSYFDMDNGGFLKLKLFDSSNKEIILNEEVLRN